MNPTTNTQNPIYLVRPDDFHIFELDSENNCYRSYSTRDVTDREGIRPPAQTHFTLENLTRNCGFFPIDTIEIPFYEERNKEYYRILEKGMPSNGHGNDEE